MFLIMYSGASQKFFKKKAPGPLPEALFKQTYFT